MRQLGRRTGHLEAVDQRHLQRRLWIEVSPWAVVAIDGSVRDTVSQQEHLLIVKPGPHNLSLRHRILGVYDTTFTIAPKEVKELRFNLKTLLGK